MERIVETLPCSTAATNVQLASGRLGPVSGAAGVPPLRGDEDEGEGCGESLSRFPVGRGDHMAADRGYSTAGGLMHVEAADGYDGAVNTQALRFRTPGGRGCSTCWRRYRRSSAPGRSSRGGRGRSAPAAGCGRARVRDAEERGGRRAG